MADNVPVTPGTGADIATDDVSGVHYQVIKLALGADGVVDCLVDSGQQTMANSLPVAIASNQSAIPVSGTFWQTTQPVSGTFYQATQPVSIATMPTTPVTGTFWQATQPVSGTFWQATQPVSLASLPALSAGTNLIGGVKIYDESGTIQADVLDLTNSNPLTVALVDGSGNQITSFGGGTEYTEDAVPPADPVGKSILYVRTDSPGAIAVNGDWIAQRGTAYGATFATLLKMDGSEPSFGGGVEYTEGSTAVTATGKVILAESGANTFYPVSITAQGGGLKVDLTTIAGNGLGATLPVSDGGASLTVDGTFWQATQPISASSLPLPTGAATETSLATIAGAIRAEDTGHSSGHTGIMMLGVRNEGHADFSGTDLDYIPIGVDASGSVFVKPDGTFPVSLATLPSLAAGSALIGGVKLIDTAGTFQANIFDLTNSNPLAVAIVDGSGSQITSFGGGVQYTENDTDASITGTAVMYEGSANVLKVASSTVGSALPVSLEFTNPNTQPIYTQICGSGLTAKADVIDLTTYNGLAVAIVDGSGNHITSFGGGTQYTEAASAATDPVGTSLNLVSIATPGSEVTAGQNVAARGTIKGELYVKHVDSIPVTGTVTVSGTVTANAGTNLNTSALALESGGNLALIKTSVQLLDDVVYAASGTISNFVVIGGHTGTGAIVWDMDSAGRGAVTLQSDITLGTSIYTEASSRANAVAIAVRKDTPGTLVNTDNEWGPLQMDSTGNLRVTVVSAPTTAVTGTFWQATQPVSSSQLPAALAAGGGIKVEGVAGGVAQPVSGTFWQATQPVSGTFWQATQPISGTVTANAGTGTLAVSLASLPASTNTIEVVGDAAHAASIAGNPVRLGGRALTTDYSAVTAGQVADLITTLLGKLVTIPFANPNQTWNYAAASGGIVNTTGVTIKASGGAGVRNYITHLDVVNGHATVSTDVQIRDGAAGTVLWRGFAQAAGGGYSIDFPTPIRGSAATLLEVACGTTGSATYINAWGYTAAE